MSLAVEPITGAQGPKPLLSDSQRLLHDRLIALDASGGLALMYVGALAVGSQSGNPERWAQAAHSLRELMEKIFRWGDFPGAKADDRSLTDRVQSLRTIWNKSTVRDKTGAKPQWRPKNDESLGPLLTDIGEFFGVVAVSRPSRPERGIHIFRGLDPSGEPLPPMLETPWVRAWRECDDYFQSVAHHKRIPVIDDFRVQLTTLESLLLNRLRPDVVADQAGLDRIITEAGNGPTVESVNRAFEAMRGHASNYYHFFGALQSGAWIVPLRELQLFRSPPDPIANGDRVQIPFWPLSRYLIRMAPLDPAAVATVIANDVPVECENFRVHTDLANAVLKLPPPLAATVVGKLSGWLTQSDDSLYPDRLGHVVEHLVRGGQTAAALKLAESLLTVIPDERLGRRVRAHLDAWHYGRLLHGPVRVLYEVAPKEVLATLMGNLEAAMDWRYPEREGGRRHDYSYIWHRNIANATDEERTGDVEDHLVTAVRDCLDLVASREAPAVPNLVVTLEARPWSIFHRLALNLIHRLRASYPGLARERLLDKERFRRVIAFPEYWVLLRDEFPSLVPSDKATILGWIDEGPDWELPKDAAEANRAWAQWQLQWLLPIRDALPAKWQKRYRALVRVTGEPQTPEFLERTYLLHGAKSPRDPEELAALNLDDLREYLMSWQPTGSFREASREGLAHTLGSVIERDPERFAVGAEQFIGLDPTYVRTLMNGLRHALGKNVRLEWPGILRLADWAVRQSDPGEVKRRADGDSDWAGTRRAVVDLVAGGLGSSATAIPFAHRKLVWDVLLPLSDDAFPSPEDDARDAKAGEDILTRALNGTRAEALDAVLRYALWVKDRIESVGDKWEGLATVPEVRGVLDQHLDPSKDPSPAVRAVYGRWLHNLFALDEEWVDAHQSAIFSRERELRRAVWEAYVITHSLHLRVYDRLAGEYAWAINRLAARAPAATKTHQEADRALARNLMSLVLSRRPNFRDSDGVVPHFFTKADPRLRRYALESVGRYFHDLAKPLTRLDARYFMAFWEWRVTVAGRSKGTESRQELGAFGWWFASRRFPRSWSLEQLLAATTIAREIEPAGDVVNSLAAGGIRQITLRLACLDAIVRAATPGRYPGWEEEDADRLLVAGLSAKHRAIRVSAKAIVAFLVAAGHSRYKQLLATDEREVV